MKLMSALFIGLFSTTNAFCQGSIEQNVCCSVLAYRRCRRVQGLPKQVLLILDNPCLYRLAIGMITAVSPEGGRGCTKLQGEKDKTSSSACPARANGISILLLYQRPHKLNRQRYIPPHGASHAPRETLHSPGPSFLLRCVLHMPLECAEQLEAVVGTCLRLFNSFTDEVDGGKGVAYKCVHRMREGGEGGGG